MIKDYKYYRCNVCGEEMEYTCDIFECDLCESSDIEEVMESEVENNG